MADQTADQAAAQDTAIQGAPAADPQLALLYGRVLAGDIGLTQVWFHAAVLEKYRAQTGVRVLRSNSAGRVRTQGGWNLDFGIADDDRLIHASAADLAQRLPAAERRHWLGYIIAPPVSGTFLVMRLGAGHCMDDGDIRDWTA
jgi:hypothetical protein